MSAPNMPAIGYYHHTTQMSRTFPHANIVGSKIGSICRPVGNEREEMIRPGTDQLLIHQNPFQGETATITIVPTPRTKVMKTALTLRMEDML
jgi:hypothetical protein